MNFLRDKNRHTCKTYYSKILWGNVRNITKLTKSVSILLMLFFMGMLTTEMNFLTLRASAVQLAEWTFMVYLDADNNLESCGIEDFLEMASVGSTPEVNIVVQFDRTPGWWHWDPETEQWIWLDDSRYGNWTDCKRFLVGKDMEPWPENAVQDLGEVNMADSDTLTSFTTWTVTNYPATHYCLVLWDHGSGCVCEHMDSQSKMYGYKGVCWDDSYPGDYITMVELKQALSLGGVHFDVIGFDACYMGMVEVVYQIKDYADYIVASEEWEPGEGWPYDAILSDLTANATMDGGVLSSVIVAKYGEYYGPYGVNPIPWTTMAAVNASCLSSLRLMVNDFAQKLRDNLPFYEVEIKQSRNYAEKYRDDLFVDLYDFTEFIGLLVPEEVVQMAANNVMAVFDDAMISEWHYEGGYHPNSHGLTIYFTKQDIPPRYYDREYNDLDFSKETKWDEFIKIYAILDWPMFHHDPRHAGYSPSPAPRTNKTLWSFQTDGSVFSSPAVADGMVFVGSVDGYVYALNQCIGEPVWSFQSGGPVQSSPAVADGMVFVGSHDQYVYALDEFTGESIWSYRTGGSVLSSPAVAYGMVFVGSNDGNIYILDEYSGEFIDSFPTDGPVFSSPAVNAYYIFWGFSDVLSSPAVVDYMVFVGSSDGNVYAWDEFTAELVWNYTTGSWVNSSPAVADGMVFVGSNDSRVYALDEFTGELIWSYETGGSVISSPAVAGGMVFVGSHDNKTYALDGSTGTVMWSYETGGPVDSSPAVANGMVFVGSNDGKVYAFGQPFTRTHDIAVTSVAPSKTVVGIGDSISINVTVENQGYFTETFNVTAYYNNTPIEKQTVTDLAPNTNTTITFIWDTTSLAIGNYTISAYATAVLEETDTDDNIYIDDVVNVVPHADIAVTDVISSKTVVGQGCFLHINVTVENQGHFTEVFNLTTYANTTIIKTKETTLTSGSSTTIIFIWNTTGFVKGNYTISAYATPVPGETDTVDNTYCDGWVVVAMVGDITGPDGFPDGKVEMRDVSLVASKFGVNYPDPRYDANCDITGPTPGVADGKIEMRDVSLVASNFGKIDP